MSSDLGVIGMAVMGRNLALNCAEKGFKVSVYNRTKERTDEAVKGAKVENLDLIGNYSLKDFVESLCSPRKVLIMVKAGAPAEAMMESLLRVLSVGDIVIDCGNEHYKESEKRFELCDGYGVQYVSMGVSGGEEGARKGPSLMIGTNEQTYRLIKPFCDNIAARAGDLICSALVGPRGSGHYVKMVHNGIEYAIMEIIAEIYDILRTTGYSHDEMAAFFSRHPAYLTEITAKILRTKDQIGGQIDYLIDKVLDKAGSKGTGKWTVLEAVNLGVPCPMISASLDSRCLSNITKGSGIGKSEKLISLETLEKTLYAGILICYAEGFNLLHHAHLHYGYAPNLQLIGYCWMNGCIIRSDTLKEIIEILPSHSDTILNSPKIFEKINLDEWTKATNFALSQSIPVPGLCSGLCHIMAIQRKTSSPLNLIQAQRDYFGAHTFKRSDFPGENFHANWESGIQTRTPE